MADGRKVEADYLRGNCIEGSSDLGAGARTVNDGDRHE